MENENVSGAEVKANDAPQVNTSQAPVVDDNKPAISNENEINWRKFREQRDQDRKLAEESARRAAEKEAEAAAMKAAMEALLNKPHPNQYGDETNEESDEEKIEKKVNAILAKREVQMAQERAQREAQDLPQKLSQAYSDFNTVCSSENLDYLEFHYPEVATPYKHMPEGFEKWASIYKAVKKFVPNPDSKKDVKKAEANLKRPQSISSPGMTESGQAMPAARLDEARKAENWARMQKTLKGLSA